MRKLKLQMSITLDGFVAGPNGEGDWLIRDGQVMDLAHSIAASSDTLLMGRKMTSDFTTYWENVVNNEPESRDHAFAAALVGIPKIVFSKTVTNMPGKNVTVERGELIEVVSKLKNQPGQDILVYGGATFVSSLIKEKLIDEFHFLVNPVFINKGLRIFDLLAERQKLSLVTVTKFDCGVAALTYHAK